MKKHGIILATALILLLAGACEKSEFLSDGDFFHLDNDGARMPVWVNGNFDSDVILITVHGGPGDSGMNFAVTPGFELLEEDYMIAYWDQRFSGMAQGHPDMETMDPDQFIEDTEKIVQLIQHRYPGKKLFLLGHSWGGQLTAGYLGRDNNDSNFRGWIDLNGSISAALESQWMKEWILERVPSKMAEPDSDKELLQYMLDWYEANPNPDNYGVGEPYYFVSALSGDVYDLEKYYETLEIPYGKLIFRSMFSMSYYVYAFGNIEDIAESNELDYAPGLANITIPALMLWGAEDGIVPAKVADHVYANLGTDPSMKKVVKIPECGHGPFVEQPEIFRQEVSDFIETYK